MATLIAQVAMANTLLSTLKPEGKAPVGTSYGDCSLRNSPLVCLLSSSAHHPAIPVAPPPT